MKIKAERLSSQIAREVAKILHEKARSEMLKSVTVTAAEVSNDYSVAKVWYTFLGDYDKKLVDEELKNAAGYLRSELANRIDVRHTPELRFTFDESIAYGSNIERILNQINEEK